MNPIITTCNGRVAHINCNGSSAFKRLEETLLRKDCPLISITGRTSNPDGLEDDVAIPFFAALGNSRVRDFTLTGNISKFAMEKFVELVVVSNTAPKHATIFIDLANTSLDACQVLALGLARSDSRIAIVEYVLSITDPAHNIACIEVLMQTLCILNNRVYAVCFSGPPLSPTCVASISSALVHPHNRVSRVSGWHHIQGSDAAQMLTDALRSPRCKVEMSTFHTGTATTPQDLRNIVQGRKLLVLRQAQEVPRLGSKSALNRLPRDLTRMLAGFVVSS